MKSENSKGVNLKEVILRFNSQKDKNTDKQMSKLIKDYGLKLKFIDTLAAFLGFSGISIEYYLTQILFYGNPQYEITPKYNILCYANITFTLLLLICILSRYFIRSRLLNIQKANLEGDLNKTLLGNLILELLICSIISLPNVNLKWTGSMRGSNFTYHMTDIIMIVSLSRCYLILRLYVQYSKWTSFESSQVCKRYGTAPNAVFAIKSDLKDRPFVTISIVIISLVIIFGIAVMQSEKSFDGKVANMDQLTNAEWLTIITMTTVGYGDLYPNTHFGRFFCLLACISGMILVSAMIVSLNLACEFDKSQFSSYVAIRKVNREKEFLSSAANVVKAAFRAKRNQSGPIKKFRSVLFIKKQNYVFMKMFHMNSQMDITSSEVLYDLQHRLEDSLNTAKNVVCDIPNLKNRCDRIKINQKNIDEKLEKIIKQQNIIAKYSSGSPLIK